MATFINTTIALVRIMFAPKFSVSIVPLAIEGGKA